jgi:hypothetical protein
MKLKIQISAIDVLNGSLKCNSKIESKTEGQLERVMGMAAALPCAWPSLRSGRCAHQIGNPADLSNRHYRVGSILEWILSMDCREVWALLRNWSG